VVLVGSGRLGKYIFRYSDALPAAAFVLKLKCQASGVSTPQCNNDNSMKWLVFGGWEKERSFQKEQDVQPTDSQQRLSKKGRTKAHSLAGQIAFCCIKTG